MKSKNTPSAIILSRQKLPYINPFFTKENKCELGAYVVNKTSQNYAVNLIASGSEVEIALEAQKKLKKINIDSKVISMPCLELFEKQSSEYKNKILGKNSFRVTIEAGVTMGWEKYTTNGISFGINSFGKSAPYKQIYKHFGLTSENIFSEIRKNYK